jgi:hypothetical protein
MDHLDCIANAHRIGLALHRENSRKPLPQGLSAIARRVELAGRSPEAGTTEGIRASYIARSTGPQ